MSVQTGPLQLRRLASAQLGIVTPAAGEPVFNTDTKQLVVGDGATAGGIGVAPLESPVFTGIPEVPTASPGDSSTQAASTAFVNAVAAVLSAVDALKAPLASPALTGVPTAPTAAVGTNTNQLATMAALQARILGTVAQSGGIPTGAIVETGTNANGTYTKWADGTMICRHTGAGQAATIGGGSVFYSGGVNFTFPATFITAPTITPSAVQSSGFFCWGVVDGSPSTTNATVRVICPVNTGSASPSYIAIGRWF